MSETMLVPLDYSGLGQAIAERAATLAARLGDAVVLLNVVQVPVGVSPFTVLHTGDADEGQTALHALEEDAHDALKRLAEPFVDRGIPTRLEVRAGAPATVIIECAEALGASMIVMGTHGRGGLGRLMLGSVTERVIRSAPCPVLAIRVQGADTAKTSSQDHVIAESDG